MPKNGSISQTGPAVTKEIPTPAGGVQLVTFVPLKFVRQQVKRQIIPPQDVPQEFFNKSYNEQRVRKNAKDSALMRALGLAHYWQRLLNEGRFNTIAEIAKAEGIDSSRASKIYRLTLLAPAVIERLVGTQDIALDRVIRRTWPIDWIDQMRQLQELVPPP